MDKKYSENLNINSQSSMKGSDNTHYMLKMHERGMYLDHDDYISSFNVSTNYDIDDIWSLNLTTFGNDVYDKYFNGSKKLIKHKSYWNDSTPYQYPLMLSCTAEVLERMFYHSN